MSNTGTQGTCSSNCMACVVRSNDDHSATPRISVTSEMIRESQRTAGVPLLPAPTASTAAPPMIGTHMSRLRSGRSGLMGWLRVSGLEDHERGEQHEQPDNDRERVVEQIARLHVPDPARDARYAEGGAVDGDAVDHRGVAHAPEQAPDSARPGGEKAIVEVVEAVSADEGGMHGREAALDKGRQVGTAQVQVPGGEQPR